MPDDRRHGCWYSPWLICSRRGRQHPDVHAVAFRSLDAGCAICGEMFGSLEARGEHYRSAHGRIGRSSGQPSTESSVSEPLLEVRYVPWELRERLARLREPDDGFERYASLKIKRVLRGALRYEYSFDTGARAVRFVVDEPPKTPQLLNELASEGWWVLSIETTGRALFSSEGLDEVSLPVETTVWLERRLRQ